VIVSAMLQVLRGVALATVLEGLRAGGAPAFTGAESPALAEVAGVRNGTTPGGAYAALRGESW